MTRKDKEKLQMNHNFINLISDDINLLNNISRFLSPSTTTTTSVRKLSTNIDTVTNTDTNTDNTNEDTNADTDTRDTDIFIHSGI